MRLFFGHTQGQNDSLTHTVLALPMATFENFLRHGIEIVQKMQVLAQQQALAEAQAKAKAQSEQPAA